MTNLRNFVIAAIMRDKKKMRACRSDKTRWEVVCSGVVGTGEEQQKCAWFVKVKKQKAADGGLFEVSCPYDHTCLGPVTDKSERFTGRNVRTTHKDALASASHTPAQVQANAAGNPRYGVARRAIMASVKERWGSGEDSWRQVPNYLLKLEEADAATKTYHGTGLVVEGPFICFGAAQKALPHLAPVYAADATHCDGEGATGVLFFFVGVDPLSRIYPLSMMWAPAENGDCWKQFLTQTAKALGLSAGGTLYTDHFKGIESTVASVLPLFVHLLCGTHLKRTVAKFGKDTVEKFSLLERCTTHRAFNEILAAIGKKSSAAKEYLHRYAPMFADVKVPTTTVRAYHYGTNVAESCNNWMGARRHLPILGVLDSFRVKCMEMFATRRKESENLVDVELTPFFRSKIELLCNDAQTFRVTPSSDTEYEVKKRAENVNAARYKVVIPLTESDRGQASCSCPHLQVHKMCVHFVAALVFSGKQVDLFVPSFMRNSALKAVYSHGIPPIDIEELDADHSKNAPILHVKRPGRPRVKRMRVNNEHVHSSASSAKRVKLATSNPPSCPMPSDAVARPALDSDPDIRVPITRHVRGGEHRAEYECGWACMNWVLHHVGEERILYSLAHNVQSHLSGSLASLGDQSEEELLGGNFSVSTIMLILLSRGVLVSHADVPSNPRALVGYLMGPQQGGHPHWVTGLEDEAGSGYRIMDTDEPEQVMTFRQLQSEFAAWEIFSVQVMEQMTVAQLKEEASGRMPDTRLPTLKADLVRALAQSAVNVCPILRRP